MYKEASSLSQSENLEHVLHHLHECTWDYALLSWWPSTFAQAAKLRRMAASKEKDLAKIQELHSKEMKLSYDSYSKGLTILKVFTFFSLVCWFWRLPVAAISKQLVEPFGNAFLVLVLMIRLMQMQVGIIPWLILSTRVSRFICRKVFN
ncbi:hypothetical protein RHSIM_Rhsim10G0196300 [Rhododendron simsii]|uniref:Uncharacterized protein n=1 Tax=Rhododendron simsii TaxID=118357 RepID=A0A834GCE5_RHOSS|nr:hypothetical protein RHSIM_Rhsim10G0196300 [Rhododendron simsii]